MTTPTVTTLPYGPKDCHSYAYWLEFKDNAQERFDLFGLTLRQALKVLRRVDWGDHNYMPAVSLSDGSTLAVHNASTDDGQGILPGVHVAVREWVRTGRTRTYKL
jgi:hypothetical protein